jgi:hypothetical protein
VIIDSRIERIGVELHFLARKDIALPRLNTQGAAPGNQHHSNHCAYKIQAAIHGLSYEYGLLLGQ